MSASHINTLQPAGQIREMGRAAACSTAPSMRLDAVASLNQSRVTPESPQQTARNRSRSAPRGCRVFQLSGLISCPHIGANTVNVFSGDHDTRGSRRA